MTIIKDTELPCLCSDKPSHVKRMEIFEKEIRNATDKYTGPAGSEFQLVTINGSEYGKFTFGVNVWGKSKEDKEEIKNSWVKEIVEITEKYYNSYFYNIIETDNIDEEYIEMTLHIKNIYEK